MPTTITGSIVTPTGIIEGTLEIVDGKIARVSEGLVSDPTYD